MKLSPPVNLSSVPYPQNHDFIFFDIENNPIITNPEPVAAKAVVGQGFGAPQWVRLKSEQGLTDAGFNLFLQFLNIFDSPPGINKPVVH